MVALVARLVVVWELYKNNPGFYSPDVDSGWHYMWAKNLASGNWLGTEVFYRAPLYPYLLGIWFTIFGDDLLLVRFAQAFLGAVTAGLVALIGWRTLGRRVGIAAGLIWAIWGPMIYYESEILIPVVAIPLNLLALWLALGHQRDHSPRVWSWLGIGAIVGVSAIARPNILIAAPAFLWMAWQASRTDDEHRLPLMRRLPALVALLVGMALPILPVTVRNYVVGHDVVMIAYQGGVNLYIGNNPDADGLTMQMPEVVLDPIIGWDRFVGTTDSIACALSGRELSPSEISGFWTGKALAYIGSNPLEAVWGWLRKTYYVFSGFEAGDQTDVYAFTRFSKVLRVLIWASPLYIPLGLIAPFGLLGIAWSWKYAARTRPLTLFMFLYAVSVILFLATARHRLPILPIVVIYAVAGFWVLLGWWREHRWRQFALGAGSVLALGFCLNQPGAERMMSDPAFPIYQEALVYDRLGDYPRAIERYDKALELQPLLMAARRNLALTLVRNKQYDRAVEVGFSYLRAYQHDAEAINNLGLAYLGQGDTNKALGSFRIAGRENPKLGQPHLNLGNIALARGEAVEAAGAYGRAIAADSSFGAAYNALGVLLARGGLPDSAIAILRLCTERNPGYPSAWLNLGNVLVESERYPEAIIAMKRALELTPESGAVRYNLAVAYVKSGNLDEGRRQLAALLEREPDHQEAQQLLKTIQTPPENSRE